MAARRLCTGWIREGWCRSPEAPSVSLQNHPAGLGRLLARAGQLGAGCTYGERLAKDFARLVGNAESVDALRSRSSGLRPEWRQPLRTLASTKDGWLQIAFPKTNAVAHHVKPVGKKVCTIRGKLRFLPCR